MNRPESRPAAAAVLRLLRRSWVAEAAVLPVRAEEALNRQPIIRRTPRRRKAIKMMTAATIQHENPT